MVINLRLVCKLLSPAIFSLGILSLIPASYALITQTEGSFEFGLSAIISVLISLLLHKAGNKTYNNISLRELFLFTGSLWFIMTVIAAIPFYLVLSDVNLSAAIFESASGLSTTGATVINNLEARPRSILLWRSILQFLGGMGFVVVAVAILPNMAMGGMNIFKTESTSFDGNAKITPHIKTMAMSLLAWYMLTLFLCIFMYILGGYDSWMAINAALCTVSTGGMMPLDASMNGAPPFIHYTCIVFMILGSLPFLLILGSISGSVNTLIKDQQVRGFQQLVMSITLAIAASLILCNNYDLERAVRTALFNVTAILSSTGFNLEDFTAWNQFASITFLIILAVGGCSGSTSGGIKLFRLQICFSMFKIQLIKSIHPHEVLEPRFNRRDIDSDTLRSVITYFVAYIILLMVSATTASVLGLDLIDSITGTISALSNIGPAIGPILGPANNFSSLNDGLHLLFSFDMILGRLEILPVLLCMTRMFWRR